METIRVVAERAPYLLIAHHDRFAVVERRNSMLYSLYHRHRGPYLMTDAGVLAVVGSDWCDEETAYRLFTEVVTRYTDLSEHLW